MYNRLLSRACRLHRGNPIYTTGTRERVSHSAAVIAMVSPRCKLSNIPKTVSDLAQLIRRNSFLSFVSVISPGFFSYSFRVVLPSRAILLSRAWFYAYGYIRLGGWSFLLEGKDTCNVSVLLVPHSLQFTPSLVKYVIPLTLIVHPTLRDSLNRARVLS